MADRGLKPPSSYERIYRVVKRIPRGRVASYGDVAHLAGLGGAARQVGYALHALPEGSLLKLDGPHGFFTREGVTHQPALFVGTGTGVCPLRAMLQAELAAQSGPPLQLLFGVRHEQAAAYAKAITKYATYVTTSCISDALDDLPDGIDVPDISLPGS